jgi:xylose isomerase
MVGSHNFLEYVEFVYYARKLGYSDFFTSDTSPTRWDIKKTFEANARITNKIWNLFDRFDDGEFGALISGGDYVSTFKFIEEHIFKLPT